MGVTPIDTTPETHTFSVTTNVQGTNHLEPAG